MKTEHSYGYFDDAAREYVVTDHFPPWPWINFLSNDNFTAIVSQSGGGGAFYRDASTGRLTKYGQVRSVPMDRPGFYLYLREADGSFWTPTFEPVRTELDEWKCRHGLGYSRFEAVRVGLTATLTLFVPQDDNALVWDITLHNARQVPTELSTFAFVEFNFLLALREPQYWQWCRFYTSTTFDAALNAIRYDYHVYEDQPKVKVLFASSLPVSGYDCDRKAFLGRRGTFDAPETVQAGALANSQLPGGGFPVGALQNRLTLTPGETRHFTVTLAGALTWPDAATLVRKYSVADVAQTEFERVQTYWANYLSVLQTQLSDVDMQRMINIWNPYNCSIAFNRKKGITAATTGMERAAVQSRDSSQDAMSLVSLRPELARSRLEEIYRFQKPSGEYFSSFDPDAGEALEYYAVRSDNGVWPVFTTYAYVAETGERDFLSLSLPYHEGPEASVLAHMAQGLRHIGGQRGRNGLPLIIDVDWNDNLYIFKETGQEESVMLAQQLVYAARLVKEMADQVGEAEIAAFCAQLIGEMTINLNQKGIWDGEWYARYIFATNKPSLGSNLRREGKIFLNTQSWAVISGTAMPVERATQCMDKARELLGTPFGLKLMTPPFTGIPEPEDALFNNGPGIRENGGIFHHAHVWAVLAETMLGHGDRAYELYRQVLPNVASAERGPDVYINEPYAFSSTTLIDPDLRPGEADMAWFTGTVTWMYLVGTQYILGIRPVLAGLLIDPCIPAAWDGYRVERRYKGVMHRIVVKNPHHVCRGVKSILVDGVLVQGRVLPAVTGRQSVEIEVKMG